MIRRLFILLPPLLLLVIGGLWIISHFRYLDVSYGTSQRVLQLAVSQGRCRLLHKSMPVPTSAPWRSKSGPPLEWRRGLAFATDIVPDGEQAYLWERPLLSVTGEYGWPPAIRVPGGICFKRGTICEDSPDSEDSYYYPVWFLESPLAWPTLLATFPAALSLLAWRRHRQRNCHGLCPTCSYDLRAHKPGERCPECGTVMGGSDETPRCGVAKRGV